MALIVCEAKIGDTIKFGHLQDGQPYPEITEYHKKFEKNILTYKLHNLSMGQNNSNFNRHNNTAT